MDTLAQTHCIAWHSGEAAVSGRQMLELHRDVPDWHIIESGGLMSLQRVFTFSTFGEALAFTGKVGRIAQEEEHHPSILTEWGRVRVSWWTQAVRGLHRNDFIMAAKTDLLYQPSRVIAH